MAENSNLEYSFVIKEHFGVINTRDNGWTRELNLVSWNDGVPKYDIRDWNDKHDRMSRGITLTADDMRGLARVMQGREY